jgi:hypothetical protein
MSIFEMDTSQLDEIQPGFFDNFSILTQLAMRGNRCADAILGDVHLIDFNENREFHQCFANWFMPRP